jgi:uncharacterized protein (DUF2225 family)
VTTTDSRRVTCPNCRGKFEITVVMSHTTSGRDTDFRPISAGSPIIDLVIHTCPRCGLTGYEDRFETKVPREVSQLIEQRITPLVRDERSQPWRRYEYAAWIAGWQGEGDAAVADLYLRAAWCCREKIDDETQQVESYYRAKAAEHFERALAADRVQADEIDVITYLIGELRRRVGEFGDAKSWLAKAVRLADGVDGRQWVADIARRQAMLAGRNERGDAQAE